MCLDYLCAFLTLPYLTLPYLTLPYQSLSFCWYEMRKTQDSTPNKHSGSLPQESD
jgi:hypothetical protein